MSAYVTQEELDWCSSRMEEAVRRWANGSADEFGRLLGYANGGFIREVIGKKKPIGKAIRHRLREHLPEAEEFLTYQSASQLTSHLINIDEPGALAHAMSYTPHIIPTLTREELMKMGKIPQEFWMALLDDALGARAPKGTLALFTTDGTPAWGDAVLIQTADGEHHVRVYAQSAEHRWQATAPNPNYMALHAGMPGIKIIATLATIRAGWAQLNR